MKRWANFVLCLTVLAGLFASLSAEAEEIHIYSDGKIHLVDAKVLFKHATNLITIKSWDRKWMMSLDDSTELESAYGQQIKAEDVLEGHLIEIKGRLVFNKTTQDYATIDPILIRDLDVKTGEPLPMASVVAPSLPPPPPPLPAVVPLQRDEGGTSVIAAPSSSSGTANKFTTYLRKGSWGIQVKKLQNFLKKHGFMPPKDESTTYFGPSTEAALKRFQQANAIEASGTLGPKTRKLINTITGNQ